MDKLVCPCVTTQAERLLLSFAPQLDLQLTAKFSCRFCKNFTIERLTAFSLNNLKKGHIMKRNTKIILTTTCVVLVALAVFLVFSHSRQKKEVKGIQEAVHHAEKETLVVKEQEPEKKKVYKIKKRVEPLVPDETLPEVSSAPATTPRVIRVEKNYDEIHQEVIRFFRYLDHKDYIKTYELKEGTYKHFLKLIGKLSANPPVISGETRDIYTLTHNIAHFYGVVGKKDVLLIRDILSNERKITEPTMKLFYEWITKGIENKKEEVETTTKDLYEYAGFFLNTLGGKAYLSRRDSRTRTLVTYYSLLILDKANRERLNRHGIDIRPPLTLLIDNIRNQKNLKCKREYLKRLKVIREGIEG